MIYKSMKHTRLFEEFLFEFDINKRFEISDKIRDARGKIIKLEQKLRKIRSSNTPDKNKIEIVRIQIQKQQLKIQSLQLDLNILSLKK